MGGDTVNTADTKWPKTYSISFKMVRAWMLSCWLKSPHHNELIQFHTELFFGKQCVPYKRLFSKRKHWTEAAESNHFGLYMTYKTEFTAGRSSENLAAKWFIY